MFFIELNKIMLYGYHGCLKEEKIIGNYFILDIKLKVNIKYNGIDKLENTIDYASVYKILKIEFLIRSNTLEHLSYRIIKSIKKKFINIVKIKVKLCKLNTFLDTGSTIKKTCVIMYH